MYICKAVHDHAGTTLAIATGKVYEKKEAKKYISISNRRCLSTRRFNYDHYLIMTICEHSMNMIYGVGVSLKAPERLCISIN